MATKKPENLSFEEALDELSKIVAQMEQGELSLEQSLKQFERGIACECLIRKITTSRTKSGHING